jgi:hypothetical protein|tara:strand:- start:368 stop:544 length:177 start_codon:yes stop_codon:yes gene_type:complete
MEENLYSSIQSILSEKIDYQQLSYSERVEAESIILKGFVEHYDKSLVPLLKNYLESLK